MQAFRQLAPGEPAPWFRQRSTSNPMYAFDTVAGRYLVLCFFLSAADAAGRAALGWLQENRSLFDDDNIACFGVSVDPQDETSGRVRPLLPGIRHFWDFDGSICRLYGAYPATGEPRAMRRIWVVLNPGLQVLEVLPFEADGSDRARLAALLRSLPPVTHYGGMEMHAPVIVVPHVLDAALCRQLIDAHVAHGGEHSGFMRDIDGKTVAVHDPGHKKRTDYLVDDAPLRGVLQKRIQQTVVPIIRKVHSFEVTRMERYLVGCYSSEDGGHFRPHRDNTTRGTAHRRFAVSVNLNADFEGGELGFPEYGPRLYKPPPGCAIVFAGALLHTVTPVRTGRRFAFLPFLYDEAAARLREENNPHLGEGVGAYHAGPRGLPRTAQDTAEGP